jgi:hypothetical protein
LIFSADVEETITARFQWRNTLMQVAEHQCFVERSLKNTCLQEFLKFFSIADPIQKLYHIFIKYNVDYLEYSLKLAAIQYQKIKQQNELNSRNLRALG